MRLSISSFYADPGFYFSISHKVDNFIRDKLTEVVMIPYGLDKKDPNIFLGLDVTTSSKTYSLEVKGPEYDKKNGFINWGLWLPYKEIAEETDQLIPYLKYFFDAIALVFKNYNINEKEIRKVKKIVEDEVINNPEYFFMEEETPQPDLSDLDI
jgi:hypothetical protein